MKAQTEDLPSVAEMMAELDAIARNIGITFDHASEQANGDFSQRTRYAKPGQRCGRGRVRKISEAQLSFLLRLFKTKDVSKLVRLPGSEDIYNMSLAGARDLIDRLLACPDLPKEKVAPRPATEPMVKFVQSLLHSKEITEEYATTVRDALSAGLTFADAKSFIETMKALPAKTVKAEVSDFWSKVASIPAGGYAFEIDGTVKFYVVRESRSGRKYLNAKASNDTFPMKWSTAMVEKLTDEETRKAAGALYGVELGICCKCQRELTSEYRHLGVGPICINK